MCLCLKSLWAEREVLSQNGEVPQGGLDFVAHSIASLLSGGAHPTTSHHRPCRNACCTRFLLNISTNARTAILFCRKLIYLDKVAGGCEKCEAEVTEVRIGQFGWCWKQTDCLQYTKYNLLLAEVKLKQYFYLFFYLVGWLGCHLSRGGHYCVILILKNTVIELEFVWHFHIQFSLAVWLTINLDIVRLNRKIFVGIKYETTRCAGEMFC